MATKTTAAGNEYEALEYVDPHPDLKGDDIVSEDCGNCGGTGVYYGKSGYEFYTATEGAVTTGCFACHGTGKHSRKVSSARSTARRRVTAENNRRAADADWEADAPAREAREAEEARQAEEAAAKAEAERLAAMVQGFAGEEGERLRNLECEVVTEYQYEAVAFNGYSMELRAIIVFRVIESGKILKWSSRAQGLKAGEKVTVTGTVKGHGNYEGQDQTDLTRCIVKRAEEAADA